MSAEEISKCELRNTKSLQRTILRLEEERHVLRQRVGVLADLVTDLLAQIDRGRELDKTLIAEMRVQVEGITTPDAP